MAAGEAPAIEEHQVEFEWRDEEEGEGESVVLRATLTIARAPTATPTPTPAPQTEAAPADGAPTAAAAAAPLPPAVVLAHGYLCDRDGIRLFGALARALAARGERAAACLRLDFRGCGASGGGAARLGDYAAQGRQIGAAVRFLEEGGAGPGGRRFRVVGVLGHSKGAGAAVLWAGGRRPPPPPPPPPPQLPSAPLAHRPPALRLVLLAGRLDMTRGLDRHFAPGDLDALLSGQRPSLPVRTRELGAGGRPGRAVAFALTAKDARARLALDMAAAAGRVGASGAFRVLVIHGTADRAVPVEDGRGLWRAVAEAAAAGGPGAGGGAGAGPLAAATAGRARLLEIEGADHNFRQESHMAAALEAAVAFFCDPEEEEGDGRP